MKVPLGQLNTERIMPTDEETLNLAERIVAHRVGRCRTRAAANRSSSYPAIEDTVSPSTRYAANSSGLPPKLARNQLPPNNFDVPAATTLVNSGVSRRDFIATLRHISAKSQRR